MLFTTCENFRIQINLEIPKNALLKVIFEKLFKNL